jgi:hypothetical protein
MSLLFCFDAEYYASGSGEETENTILNVADEEGKLYGQII